MTVHPYHFHLMKCHIRLKLKGDPRTKLSCQDRREYMKLCGMKTEQNHLVKVLREEGRPPKGLAQYSLDQLVSGVGFSNWNEFLRSNPLPDGLPNFAASKKAMKQIDEKVVKRLSNGGGRQLQLELF